MIWALIPAAGRGRRMELSDRTIPKQYLPLAGRTVIEHSLDLFVEHPDITGVAVVLAGDDARWPVLAYSRHSKVVAVSGGAERADSVQAGLEFLWQKMPADGWALVHDAARPCLRREDLDRLLKKLSDDAVGGLMAVPVRDTLKRTELGRSVDTLDRSHVWQAQTPQMFRLGLLKEAMTAALKAGESVTDEAYAMERAGHRPRLVEGRADNIKITVPEDLAMAEFILRQRDGRC